MQQTPRGRPGQPARGAPPNGTPAGRRSGLNSRRDFDRRDYAASDDGGATTADDDDAMIASLAAFHAAGSSMRSSRSDAVERVSSGKTLARYSIGLMSSISHVPMIESAIAARFPPA